MRIIEVTITNFRSIKQQTINFSNYTAFVGPNGSGKSTVLTALRIFFRDSVGSATDLLTLHEEDFHQRDTATEIVITVTFGDLDHDAEDEFRHYFRHGRLIVSAVAKWDATTQSAPVKQYGQRLGMRAFAEFFRSLKAGEPVETLKQVYGALASEYQELPPASTKPTMQKALWDFEASHPELQELLRAEDEFYGFSKGANRLQKYLQWVFVPAVKDAASEQIEAKKNALGILLERTVRSKLSFDGALSELRSTFEANYRKLLQENEKALASLSGSLSARMREWAHPEANIRLQWHPDASKYISIEEPLAQVLAAEGNFSGEITRFGHGLQRSFLFVLLQELSGCQPQGNPQLILACEEPELHQHPPQAKHLASVLEALARGNSQVIVCTHSPYFVSGATFENVRLVRKDAKTQRSHVGHVSLQELADKITTARGEKQQSPNDMELEVEQALQPELNEIFFSSVLILVEGLEDIGFISTYLTLMNLWPTLRGLGCNIVACEGKGRMAQPLAIAKLLAIPCFVVFDADCDKIAKPEQRVRHERDNLAILRLCSIQNPEPFPAKTFKASGVTMWPGDLKTTFLEEFGPEEWETLEKDVRKKQGISVGHLDKNALFIGSTLNEGWSRGKKSTVLEDLCHSLVEFAKKGGP